jgi:hypothetical protein
MGICCDYSIRKTCVKKKLSGTNDIVRPPPTAVRPHQERMPGMNCISDTNLINVGA